MKTLISLFILTVFYCNTLCAQPLTWRAVPTIPQQPLASQMQDVFFINPATGWVAGQGIYKTTDGAVTWQTQSMFNQGGIAARCLGFFDEQIGIAGEYSKNSGHQSFLFRTTNSGNNWTPITNLPGVNLDSNGACGIYVVNSQTAYVLGRWGRPGMIIKTTNAGENWVRLDINNLANGLIAAHFFSGDTGIIVGNTGTGTSIATYRPVVLYTENGGTNWSVVYSGGLNQWCWKIFFLTRQIGYISLQNNSNPPYKFLKTTNGGLNWSEFSSAAPDEEGIGFINENTGWIGGDHFVGPLNFISYKTTNGGINWTQDPVLSHINKIIFLSDTLGYSVGKTLYKYSKDSISSIKNVSTEIPVTPHLSQNFPNPFNPTTKIRFYLSTALDKFVELTIYDNAGKKLETLVNEKLIPGGYEIEWNAANYPSGIYFYKLTVENYSETRKMVLVK